MTLSSRKSAPHKYKKYSRDQTAILVASLTTYPQFQANLLRIERILYSILENCSGQKRLGRGILTRWINSDTSTNRDERVLEDPAEDVFVGNVGTTHGNFRIFLGTWHHNDLYLQTIIDCLDKCGLPESQYKELHRTTFALLTLSEAIAERLDLARWSAEPSLPSEPIALPTTTDLKARTDAITFSQGDLTKLKVDPSDLQPFILNSQGRTVKEPKTAIATYLEKFPLLATNDQIAVISPHDISPAIRHNIFCILNYHSKIHKIVDETSAYHARCVEQNVFSQFAYQATLIEGLPPEHTTPPLVSWLLRYDTSRAIHMVLVNDTLSNISKGLDSVLEYPSTQMTGLAKFLVSTSSYCLSHDWCSEGFTFLIVAGVGRNIALPRCDYPSDWHWTFIKLYDLLFLSDRHDYSIEQYMKFVRYKHELQVRGIEFPPPHLCDDICLYGLWSNNNYDLTQQGDNVDDYNLIMASGLYTFEIRKESRMIADRHVAKSTGGVWSRVKRLAINSYFRSRSRIPTYVDLDSLSNQVLSGLTVTQFGPTWLGAIGCHSSGSLREIQFHLWEGILDLLFSIMASVHEKTRPVHDRPIEVRLDFSQMASATEVFASDTLEAPVIANSHIDTDNRILQLKFSQEALAKFFSPDDSAEREILKKLLEGLLRLYGQTPRDLTESNTDKIYSEMFSEREVRLLHLFSGSLGAHTIGAEWPAVYLIKDEDLSAARRRIAHSGRLNRYANVRFDTVEECNKFLQDVVEWYWQDTKNSLKELDRGGLIRTLLTLHDSITEDRVRWRIASRSLVAIHGSTEEPIAAARSLERRRTQTALALRTLLEMAVCECRYITAQELPQSTVDELVSGVSLMLTAATHSDEIFTGSVRPPIEVQGNLSYVMDRKSYVSMVDQFTSDHLQSEFLSDVSRYEMWYETHGGDESIRRLRDNSPGIDDALLAEYGLGLEELFDGVRALFAFAIDHGHDVVSSTVAELVDWIKADEEYSVETVRSFLSAFGLCHRKRWEHPPAGFVRNDIWPWRYSRRLSFTFRPVLLDGFDSDHNLYYSSRAVGHSIAILIDRLIEGHLPQEFVVSQAMKSFLGHVDDQKGSEFEDRIADQFGTAGWETRTRVPMSELGADGHLGDVDVLAWCGSGRLMVIECKRLQLARTVKEISETCERFASDGSGQAVKHSVRVRWIREHPLEVCSVIGLDSNLVRVCPRFVTSVEVPMRYLVELPNDIGEVGPLKAEEVIRS